MLPGARIIHCVRDPRDIGLSIFTFRFHGAHGYAHDLGDLGWVHRRAAAADGALEVGARANCARFHEAETRVRTVSRAQVRQPVNASGLGRWRAYAAELQPLIAELERAGALDGW